MDNILTIMGILRSFKLPSCLKVNFSKSYIFSVNVGMHFLEIVEEIRYFGASSYVGFEEANFLEEYICKPQWVFLLNFVMSFKVSWVSKLFSLGSPNVGPRFLRLSEHMCAKLREKED